MDESRKSNIKFNGKKDMIMMKAELKSMDLAKLQKASAVIRSVNHKFRQRILDVLKDNYNLSVTDIYIRLRVEQSIASQHLAVLRKAGVVVAARSGKGIYYSINLNKLNKIIDFSNDVA